LPAQPFDIDPEDFEDDEFSPEVVLDTSNDAAHNISSSVPSIHLPLKPRTSGHTGAAKCPLIQTTLPIQPISQAEYDAQESRCYHERKEECEQEAERLKLVEAQRKMAKCERNCIRKRAQHERQKQAHTALQDVGNSGKGQVSALILSHISGF
jgi:hypothetical protein